MVNSISNQLFRIKNEFIHNRIDTTCIKEYPHSFTHLGHRLGPFKVGHPYNLEHYVARIFVEEGYLKYDDGSHMNAAAIQKINFQESTNPELGGIQDHVYVQALEQLKILGILYEREQIPRRHYQQLYSDFNDLIRVRLAKIGRLAIHSQDLKMKKKLTSEEQILFDHISSDISKWRESLGTIKNQFRRKK